MSNTFRNHATINFNQPCMYQVKKVGQLNTLIEVRVRICNVSKHSAGWGQMKTLNPHFYYCIIYSTPYFLYLIQKCLTFRGRAGLLLPRCPAGGCRRQTRFLPCNKEHE